MSCGFSLSSSRGRSDDSSLAALPGSALVLQKSDGDDYGGYKMLSRSDVSITLWT